MQIARFPGAALLTPRQAEAQYIPSNYGINWDSPPWPILNGFGLYEYTAPPLTPATQKLGAVIRNGDQATSEVIDKTVDEIRPGVLAQIKAFRQAALDTISRSPGVQAVYDENRRAADLILADQGAEVIFSDVTADQFASAAAVRLGLAGGDAWATFIKSENDRERLRGKRIEEEYLDHHYGLASIDANPQLLAGRPGEYQARIDALLAATTEAEILAA